MSTQLEVTQDWDLTTVLGLFNHTPATRVLAQQTLQAQLRRVVAGITPQVSEFLTVMDVTGTVLSGSNALRFADRKSLWIPNDFDFYCNGRGFLIFCAFLETYLGAELLEVHSDDSGHIPYPLKGVVEMRRYQTSLTRLDVMCSASPSALYPLTFFHSTLVMNAISANSICIAYPQHVVDRSGLLSMHGMGDIAREAAEKYETRGYQLVAHDFHHADDGGFAQGSGCGRRHRYFGDEFCLTIPFAPLIMPAVKSQSRFARSKWTAGWTLGGASCGEFMCEDCCGPESYTAVLMDE